MSTSQNKDKHEISRCCHFLIVQVVRIKSRQLCFPSPHFSLHLLAFQFNAEENHGKFIWIIKARIMQIICVTSLFNCMRLIYKSFIFSFCHDLVSFFCPVYHRYFYISISISIEIIAYGKQKKYHWEFFKENGKNEFFICHIYFSIAMAFLSLFIQSLYSCEMKKSEKDMKNMKRLKERLE